MREPTISVSAPAVEPWITAVAAVLPAFVAYAQHRQITSDLEECRRHARISAATGALFESSVDDLFPDEEDDTPEDDATPGRPGPGAADTSE